MNGATADTELANVAGFTQLADDVRSVIDFMHYYSVIPGFQIDPVFQETCAKQLSWATMWGGVPTDLFQTETVPVSTSVFMPSIGTTVPRAQLPDDDRCRALFACAGAGRARRRGRLHHHACRR